MPVYLNKGKHHYLEHESKDQKINCTSGKKDRSSILSLSLYIRCKDRVEKYHEIHGIYRCMYVFLIPAQGVGQYVHRLVERDVPEIQKINAYKKIARI